MKKVVAEITYYEGALFHQGVNITTLVEASVLEEEDKVIKIGWGFTFADSEQSYAHECWIKKEKVLEILN